jgi:bifunctional non-homologous end joining protein LigD
VADDRLGDYRRRRTKSTPEPAGDAPASGGDGLPRFVVQEHHATRLHWDLRLEHDGVAVSWAVPNGIPEDPKSNRMAIHTEDHPLEYLDFEGDIPKGSYGAGTMRIWDRGTYEAHKFDDAKVEVTFHGERLRGRYGLFPLHRSKGEAPGKDWMIHRMDPAEDPTREPMPERVAPMLARLADLPSDQERWAFEVKWDGVRALAYSEPGRLRLEARSGNDITSRYPELHRLNRALSSHSAILDGEIVAFDEDGRPSFGRLQHRMHIASEAQARRLSKDSPVVYVIFDLLWLDGHSVMGLPYTDRRELLSRLELTGTHWQVPDYVAGDGSALQQASRAQQLEGIVAKRLDSPYEPGRRSTCWRKIKNVQRTDVVVCGWLPGEGRRRERIGALLVAVEEDGHLRYAGRVGTGFTDRELDRLGALLRPIEREDPPWTAGSKPPRGAVFVEPRYVADVEFIEWTSDGVLRAPSYKGLREDVPVPPAAFLDAVPTHPSPVRGGTEVTVEDRVLRVTNLDKVLYPRAGFTKRDVIEYLVHIAPVLLPHLRDRPLTLKRYPNGVEAGHFFEKNSPKHRPEWVQTTTVQMSSKTIDFTLAQDVPTLVWLGNLADLELHTSLSRAPAVERPTMLVFDLDPGPPATIVECCRVALWLHGMFQNLGLRTVVKTSGNKGMQVYLPLNVDGVTYEDTKPFAKAVAELLEQQAGDLVVSRMTKSLRPGKVLVDWSQNDEKKTTVNVYSLRARERPTVSTPLSWDEVRACEEAGDPGLLVFEARQVLERVERDGDLFAEALSVRQELPRL